VTLARAVRRARIGDLLPPEALPRRRLRRIDATCVLVPGKQEVGAYAAALAAAADDFAGWDGRVVVAARDGEERHRLAIVDRYGQVYDAIDADEPADLPSAAAIEEWFKFLATACPECGVVDDPVGRGWTP
jgi:hypothetical protein